MTATYTPPSVPPAPGAPGSGPNRTAARVITILIIALGAAVLLVIAWAGVRTTVASAMSFTESRDLAVDGVTDIDVDVAAGRLTVVFDDVAEATLDVEDSSGAWVFERRGDTLRVSSPDTPWFLPSFGVDNGRATLTLPEDLEGSDARLHLGAGTLIVDGEFGELGLNVSAGRLELEGAAETLELDVSAGRAEVELEDVRTADLNLSAGDLIARLSGTAPTEVRADVSAGSLDLRVPDRTYDVRSDVSAGNLDNRLRTASDASSRIFVDLSAGSVRLSAD